MMHCRAILFEKMTSYTKPEVHNVSQLLERRTEPRSQTCAKVGKVWPCNFWNMRVDRQMNRLSHQNTLHPCREAK